MDFLSTIKWGELAFNVFCSVLASLLFLFIALWFFKPKIRISPIICKDKYEDEDGDSYFFKIVNRSWFPAYDINLELLEVEKYEYEAGKDHERLKKIQLTKNSLPNISLRHPIKASRCKAGTYAVTFRTKENLEDIIGNRHQKVRLQVSLKHGLTGLMKVQKFDYVKPKNIVKGRKFGHGDDF